VIASYTCYASCRYIGTVLPISTQLREIGFVYPGFVIMIAIGLQKPYAKAESGANLVLG
jgi:hypothetical protein